MTIFDDEYKLTRYTYGLNRRPLGAYGGVPAGFIVFSNREDPRYNFGTVDYPFALTDEQVARYEMTLVKVG